MLQRTVIFLEGAIIQKEKWRMPCIKDHPWPVMHSIKDCIWFWQLMFVKPKKYEFLMFIGFKYIKIIVLQDDHHPHQCISPEYKSILQWQHTKSQLKPQTEFSKRFCVRDIFVFECDTKKYLWRRFVFLYLNVCVLIYWDTPSLPPNIPTNPSYGQLGKSSAFSLEFLFNTL